LAVRRRSLFGVVLLVGAGLLGKAGPAQGQKGEPPVPPDVTPSAPPTRSSATSLSVEMIAPEAVTPGQSAPYEMVIRNPGSTPAAAVRVEQGLPAGSLVAWTEPRAETLADRVTWNLGSVEGGGERRLKIAVQFGEIRDLPAPVVCFAPPARQRSRIDRPVLSVAVAAPDTVRNGDKLKFQIQVANNGVAPIQHVVVRDQLPDGLHFPDGTFIEADIGTLQPGEFKTVPLEVIAARSGRWVNEVSALADGGLKAQTRVDVTVADAAPSARPEDRAPQSIHARSVTPAESALAVRLIGPRRTVPGDIDLTLEVANPGTTPDTGVRLMQAVPEGLDVLAASTGGSLDVANRVVVWSLGTLGAGQKHLIALRVRARAPGDWTLSAQAVGDHLGEAKADLGLHVEAAPALRLELAAHDETLTTDAEATYEFHVVNQGSTPVTNARLTVSLPEGLTPEHAEGPTPARQSRAVVTFDPLPQLRPRADAVYRVRLRGRRPGDWRVRIELGADGARAPLLEEVGVRVTDGPGPGEPAAGAR
jgi:uncharacterized repeat protein (TIGR01451 family)